MKLKRIILFMLLTSAGFMMLFAQDQPDTKTQATSWKKVKMNRVKNEKDLEKNWDNKVEVYGVYQSMMLPESKRPGSKMIESGRIEILVGKTVLALEVQDKGFRSAEEKSRFLKKKVKVIGVIRRFVQLWGTPEEQAIVMPAVVDIESLELQ